MQGQTDDLRWIDELPRKPYTHIDKPHDHPWPPHTASDTCAICSHSNFRKCIHPWNRPFHLWASQMTHYYTLTELRNRIGTLDAP